MLEDIATLTGGEVITEELGLDLKATELSQLGRAAKVVVSKENTTIVEGSGNPDDISSRVNQLRAESEESTSEFDKEKLQERLAKLAGGDRKSTRLNSSHVAISYAVFCLKKKKQKLQ